jgi:WD40 repeat protein
MVTIISAAGSWPMSTAPVHVLVTVHGIRTFGQWQNRLNNLVRARKPDIITETYGYGYFNIFAFFLPFFRWFAVRSFRLRLRELLQRYKGADFSIVAHSFGTHIVVRGLRALPADEMPNVRLLILSGSVLKSNFDWSKLLDSNRIKRVVNDCGINDNILLLSQLFVLFTGMAGRIGFYGFTDDQLINRFHRGGHSHYFQPSGLERNAFMSRWWVPLLASDAPHVDQDERVSGGLLQGFWYSLIQIADPIKLTLYLGLALGGWHWGVYLPRQVAEGRIEARQAADLLASGRVKAAVTKSLDVLERSTPLMPQVKDLLASGRVRAAVAKSLEVLERPTPLIPQSYDVLYNALFNSSSSFKTVNLGSYHSHIELNKDGDVVFLTDAGDLSIWSQESVNKLKTQNPDLNSMSLPTFSPNKASIFFHQSMDSLGRFDLATYKLNEFTTFNSGLDSLPYNIFVMDERRLLSCENQQITEYLMPSNAASETDLTVHWRQPIKLKGNCTLIRGHGSNLVFLGTDKAQIAVFDLANRRVTQVFDGSAAGLRDIYDLIVSNNFFVAEGITEGYVLFGLASNVSYRFQSTFRPQFSEDGRFLLHGWSGEPGSPYLTIIDLTNSKLPKTSVACPGPCPVIGFIDQSRFVTLENGKLAQIRDLSTGEVLSQLFVFPTEMEEARYFAPANLLIGIENDGSAIFAKPGRKDNGVNYGGLDNMEVLSFAEWLRDDVILIVLHKINATKVERETRILVRKTSDGYEKFWVSRSDQEPKANDKWLEIVDRFINDEGLQSDRQLPIGKGRKGPLPGEDALIKVAGAGNVTARLIDGKTTMVDLDTGKPLLTMPSVASKISSLWASRDEGRFAAGSQNGVIRLWDLHIGESPILSLGAHEGGVEILTANQTQTALLSADTGGHIRVWPLMTSEQLAAAARKLVVMGNSQ